MKIKVTQISQVSIRNLWIFNFHHCGFHLSRTRIGNVWTKQFAEAIVVLWSHGRTRRCGWWWLHCQMIQKIDSFFGPCPQSPLVVVMTEILWSFKKQMLPLRQHVSWLLVTLVTKVPSQFDQQSTRRGRKLMLSYAQLAQCRYREGRPEENTAWRSFTWWISFG